ncbi:glycoside hydrolase family 38 N-terminal domain-containing protein [Acidicapsa ligni]|uniref:glycoside hydrolase family 38 N-terminal domain-containing protein n=1 Tax=Acidicapsa ligni TaxID=542300 RepID=UPI0021E055B4|nr:glycoside hydrolase family 38 C-terminal domain-containing protein [Acidicapsa ligni]
MSNLKRYTSWNRRQFVAGLTSAAAIIAGSKTTLLAASAKRVVFIVPNFHPASCGWLTTFSKERIYCANSYLSHLDRVRDDANYEFVLSEINNIIAIMNFQPQRIPELKQRVAEKRVELVNGFFLESTINLSGGEALVRLGVIGQRWYQKMFGLTPRYAWNIDTCGVHDQMPQIVSGLGMEAMVYTRKNPTGKSLYWTTAPDGSKILTLCPGSYTDASSIFSTKTPLTSPQLGELESFFANKDSITPAGAPIMVLGGSEDYSTAPAVKQYPTEFLHDWSAAEPGRQIRFTTLSRYIDIIKPEIASGHVSLPTVQAGTAYDFDAFWIDNQKVKTWYRRDEQALQASEALATIASLTTKYEYPSQYLYDAWILMSLNMDRNTLWGSAGGMVFVDQKSWDAQDRFEWVEKTTDTVLASAASSVVSSGNEVALFNPLNWKRNDPIALTLPQGKSLEGIACEKLEDGSVLCHVEMPSMSLGSWKLSDKAPESAAPTEASTTIETRYYLIKMDPATGDIASLKMKTSGRELLSGPANKVIAERPRQKPDDAGDHMPPIPERERIATSADSHSTIQVSKGPITTTIRVSGTFYGGGALHRTIRLYNNHPRIDFETELNDIPNYTVVFAEFPWAEDIRDVRRGIPYGFSHGAWATPNPELHGWTKGIVPAVRWIDYSLIGGGGIALLDRGLSGRELNNRSAAVYLINAEDKYWGYENSWLSGKGRHAMPFALLPHSEEWDQASIARAAWEYNREPVLVADRTAMPSKSFLTTSENVIVEAMRREGNHIEIRLVECIGKSGQAELALLLPHSKLTFTDLTGKPISTHAKGAHYNFPVRPQQIVTLHFETASAVAEPEQVTKWDQFVPEHKLPALHAYDPSLIGHPPFGS